MIKAYSCGLQTNINRDITVRKGEITINNINQYIYKSPFSHTYQSAANPITTPFLPYFTYFTPAMYVCGGVGREKPTRPGVFAGPSRKWKWSGGHGREKALASEKQWGGHFWGGHRWSWVAVLGWPVRSVKWSEVYPDCPGKVQTSALPFKRGAG